MARICDHSMVSIVGRTINGKWEWTGWACQHCGDPFAPVDTTVQERLRNIQTGTPNPPKSPNPNEAAR